MSGVGKGRRIAQASLWAEGLEREAVEGLDFRVAQWASTPVLPIPLPGSPSHYLAPLPGHS